MINRRDMMKAGAAMLGTAIVARPGWALANAGKTLKFVPQANLSILDPVFTTAAVSVTHGYCVFDTLYGVDNNLEPHPQMAEGATVSQDGLEWLITLRDGLVWHDGAPVTAADCAASLDRWSQRDTFGQSLRDATVAFEAADDKTIRIRLKRAFPHLLSAIGKPHSSPAMMMPERIAKTPPTEAVTEMIGSGPYRFIAEEYVSGSRVVYEKFEGYVPRSEPAEWTSGGKLAKFDRIEWHIIPDAASATAALQNGEVDWIEIALPDLQPLLDAAPNVTVQRQDPTGFAAYMRFNSHVAPFNNPKLRRAVLAAVDQAVYMNSITGSNPDNWSDCKSMFPSTMPGVLSDDWGMMPADLEAARQLVAESGYAGEKVVILHPTDMANLAPHGLITADLLAKLGLNVELQAMDWGTVTQRRQSKEPVENGGWSIFHTNWPSASISNPATNANVRGKGEAGWFGWYDDAALEQGVNDWLFASDPAVAREAFERVQKLAMEGAPVVPLGVFYVNSGLSNELSGVIPGSASFFWNVA
ncbi:ABC transporter substrate-binding protein [Stappia sp.]|uniref:ABC transporter substrate-binding protein n=1 Tax=Stappia sp. TaxID=1870903 RepID=UPI003A99D58A